MNEIIIEGIRHSFGQHLALNNINLAIDKGEFFSLIGPSGCGKSTLLNIIGGFLEPSDGSIRIGGRDITQMPPYRRNIGMVFQDYALFPHLSVYSNVAYGLTNQKMHRNEIWKRVEECLRLVHLEEYAQRMPHQLSGGQRQRVAIARALAIRPSVLLLDEPLSNLDAKLRKEMQTELRSLQRSIGITMIFVTHDQEEALSLSDRVGILKDGVIQQVGTPLEVYRKPANRFVAEFIGQANLCTASIEPAAAQNGDLVLLADDWAGGDQKPLQLCLKPQPELKGRSSVLLLLRPERIRLGDGSQSAESFNSAEVTVRNVAYVGNSLRLAASLGGRGELLIHVPDLILEVPPQIGQQLVVSWNPGDLVPVLGENKE